MPRLKTKKQPKPLLSRLMRAENAFRIAYQEHTAWGQKMVLARTELLEANAEERAKLALQYPDDPLIHAKALEAVEEMLAWYKKLGVAVQLEGQSAVEILKPLQDAINKIDT